MSDEERNLPTADLAGRTDEADLPLARDTERADEVEPDVERAEPILAAEDAEPYRTRWQELQASFVDEPQKVVELADQLVAELMQRLAETFAEERRSLEAQWARGEDVSTEDLRMALQRYRSFFERLLAT
jgi:uncharacterized coiled-coil DUF342 family protein